MTVFNRIGMTFTIGGVCRRRSSDRPRVPPSHVTLYTSQPGMKGIGLSTAAAVAAHSSALPAADAAVLRRLLSR